MGKLNIVYDSISKSDEKFHWVSAAFFYRSELFNDELLAQVVVISWAVAWVYKFCMFFGFYCSDLHLDPMALIYELKVTFWKMYPHTKNSILTWGLRKLSMTDNEQTVSHRKHCREHPHFIGICGCAGIRVLSAFECYTKIIYKLKLYPKLQ